MVSSEIMLGMMPNHPNKASKVRNKAQNLKLANGHKPRLHEASPKGPRGPKSVPRQV